MIHEHIKAGFYNGRRGSFYLSSLFKIRLIIV